jgi:hypothetical protein
MWAHYAEKHKGVCFGFDVPDNEAKRITYVPDRLLTSHEYCRTEALGNEIAETLSTTKAAAWSYESEWRLIVKKDSAVANSDGLRFVEFNSDLLTLREVILGYRCEWTKRAAVSAIGRVSAPVTVRRVQPSFAEFKMVRHKSESATYINATQSPANHSAA